MALYEDKNGSARESRDDEIGWKNQEGDKAVVTIKGTLWYHMTNDYVKVLQNNNIISSQMITLAPNNNIS
jgi:hypothetical protein